MLQKIASGWIAINILKTVLDYFILENQKSEVMKEKTRLKKIKIPIIILLIDFKIAFDIIF